MRTDVDAVNALMRAQAGAVHHRQAVALGMSERALATRLRTGAWLRAHPRVYVGGGTPLSFATRCSAAVLAVRHATRANERRPLRSPGSPPRGCTAWTFRSRRSCRWWCRSRTRRRRSTACTWHACGPGRGARSAWVDGLPVTSVADTLVDLGMLLPRDRLHSLVQEAAFARPRLPLAVAEACRRGRPGSAGARRVAALVAAGVDSSLHARGLALLRAAGLAPECGVELVPGAGRSDCVVRLAAEEPPFGLVVEWDGDAHRVDRRTFLHDREKDRLLRRAGYVTLRYTDEHVRRRTPVLDDVRAEWAALLARSVEVGAAGRRVTIYTVRARPPPGARTGRSASRRVV